MSGLNERGGMPPASASRALLPSSAAPFVEPVQPHPSDDDAPHRYERSSAEERYEWWNTDWNTGSDW